MKKKIIVVAVLAGFMLGAFSTIAISVNAKKPITLTKIYKKVKKTRNLQRGTTSLIITYLQEDQRRNWWNAYNLWITCEKVHENTPEILNHCHKPENFDFGKEHWQNMKDYR